MFKLIALVVVLVNGQPTGEPLRAVNKQTFESAEVCLAYVESERGKAELDQLKAQIAAVLPAGGTSTVTTSCEAAADNTI